ncbi:MAG: chromosomal replication initiator protein DnaA [Lachnospiraceae bacterium]|jgi:chromosomal replication initiator protein|nr:chromosomal replication initiator protein DnaA [Lachnospiraceae bacterium]
MMTDMDSNAKRINDNWNLIKEQIQEEYSLSSISYKTWVEPLTVKSVEGSVVTILVHSDQNYMLKYITERYTDFFRVTISEFMGSEYEVCFVLETAPSFEDKTTSDTLVHSARYESSNLNPKYRFETFVVGSNNKFAQSACLAVAESPGEAYNPLFIYGGAGLGKTHLMQAIGHYVLESDHNKKVLYVTSETFTNDVINSIRNHTMNSLREKYRTVDVLLIDDIQFIIGKESTQEEFFHTFNELHSQGKQIVLSSDRPPKEMETLDERFRSRFEWGLITDIQPPDYETRMAILKKYSENSPRIIGNEILEYIGTNIKSNIRELEGAYNKVIAYSRLNNVEITEEMTKDVLRDIISPESQQKVTPQMIIDTVCEHYNVSKDDISGKKRSSEIVVPRQVCMYILRKYEDLSLEQVGQLLGNRDHTTVMHGFDKIEEDLPVDKDLSTNVEIILKKLNLQN